MSLGIEASLAEIFYNFHRLNMELDLQSLFGLLCTVKLIAIGRDHRNPPPPRIWAHIRGSYWSAKIDDISL
jgi:hypothetical protein